jgi:hypothetical protein
MNCSVQLNLLWFSLSQTQRDEPFIKKNNKSWNHLVHATESCRGRGGIVPDTLNLRTRRKWVINFTPRQINLVNTEDGVGLAPKLDWTFWRREKSAAPHGIRTPDCPARSPVAVPTANALQQRAVTWFKSADWLRGTLETEFVLSEATMNIYTNIT